MHCELLLCRHQWMTTTAAAAAGMLDVLLLVTGHVVLGECQSVADMAVVMQNWQITSTQLCYTQYYTHFTAAYNDPSMMCQSTQVVAWLSIAHINKITLCRAWLVLGWVTVSGFNSQCGTFISVRDPPPKTTQPGHSFVGRCNEFIWTEWRRLAAGE